MEASEFDKRLITLIQMIEDPNTTINPSGTEKIFAILREAARKELWHEAPAELPERGIVCVTFYNGSYHINVWNDYDKCWDDEEGDDFALSLDTKLKWMALEEW